MQRCDNKVEDTFSRLNESLAAHLPRNLESFNQSMPAFVNDLLLNNTWNGEGTSRTTAPYGFFDSEPFTDDPKTQLMNDEELAHYQNIKRKQSTFKTSLCRAVKDNEECPYGKDCTFAHTFEELRMTEPRGKRHPKYKTQLCAKFAETGFCKYGNRCQYIHHLKNRALIEKREKMGIPLGENRRPDNIEPISEERSQQHIRPNPKQAPVPLMENVIPWPPQTYQERFRAQSHLRNLGPSQLDQYNFSAPPQPYFELEHSFSHSFARPNESSSGGVHKTILKHKNRK